MQVCTFVLKTATIQTLWSVFHHPGSSCVWSVVYKWTENIRYASDFSKNSECKYKQTKNTQAQQNWQSFIKMTQNWTASSETTWNSLSRKHIHIWNPSFWAPGVHFRDNFYLCQVPRSQNQIWNCPVNGKFPCLGSSKSQWTWKHSFSPKSSMIGTEHERKQANKQKTIQSRTFPHSQQFSSTGECPVEILKHTSRAAIDDTILTRGLNC